MEVKFAEIAATSNGMKLLRLLEFDDPWLSLTIQRVSASSDELSATSAKWTSACSRMSWSCQRNSKTCSGRRE